MRWSTEHVASPSSPKYRDMCTADEWPIKSPICSKKYAGVFSRTFLEAWFFWQFALPNPHMLKKTCWNQYSWKLLPFSELPCKHTAIFWTGDQLPFWKLLSVQYRGAAELIQVQRIWDPLIYTLLYQRGMGRQVDPNKRCISKFWAWFCIF